MPKTTPGDGEKKTPNHAFTLDDAKKGAQKSLEVRREKALRRKSFAEQLEALDFNVVEEAVKLYTDPACPMKVKADLLKTFTAQVYIKPKDQLASDTQRDIISDIFTFVAQAGRPTPPTLTAEPARVLPHDPGETVDLTVRDTVAPTLPDNSNGDTD